MDRNDVVNVVRGVIEEDTDVKWLDRQPKDVAETIVTLLEILQVLKNVS